VQKKKKWEKKPRKKGRKMRKTTNERDGGDISISW